MEAGETDDREGMPLLPYYVSLRITGTKKPLSFNNKKKQKWIIREVVLICMD